MRCSACSVLLLTTSCFSSRIWCKSGAREKDQRDIVLYIPDRILAYDRATGRGVILSYDFAFGGQSTKGLDRETPQSVYAKARREGFADHAPGDYQRQCRWLARRSRAATCSRLCRDSCSQNRANARRPKFSAVVQDQSVALWRVDQSRGRRIPGGGVAGNVRAVGRAADRDLSDLWHHRTRRGCHQRRQTDSGIAEFAEGRIRAQHVHRRRPQRQGACLRAGIDQGAGTAADRDLLQAVPHRRSCRGHAASGLRCARRLSHPRMGGDRHRRTETMGDAVRRGSRTLVAALVCWRARLHWLRRQHQYGPHHPHHPHEGRTCRSARWSHAAVRFRSGRGREGMPDQGGGAVSGIARRSAEAAVGFRAGCHRFRQEGAADRSRGFLRAHAGRTISVRSARPSV